jgi:uncharacterized protein (DUF983 family)
MKCPQCGEGRLFARFLKVADHCPACGEALFHHQADDYPAYIVVALVGHFLFSGILAVELAYRPPYWVHFAIWFPLALITVLALLQPVKGAVVALQWHLGLHGFEDALARRKAGAS